MSLPSCAQDSVPGEVATLLPGRELHPLKAPGLAWRTKAARYAKSLAAVAQAHDHMPAIVFELLCTILLVEPVKPPKNIGNLLELLLELGLRQHQLLPAATTAAIRALPLSGKSKSVQREILSRIASL